MDSMRHPVGPLPSTIYWRRRAVVLCLLALVTALIVWAVVSATSGDSGNKKSGADGSDGRKPAESINPTPGPSDSGAITERPGGRPSDSESGAADGGGTGGGGSGSGGTGGGSGSGGNSAGGGSGDGKAGGSVGGAGGTSEEGGTVTGGSSGSGSGGGQAAASLPDCASKNVTLGLRTDENSYDPGERPEFTLTVTNSGSSACAADLGRTSAVLTVTDKDDRHVWATDDCAPDSASEVVRVPAGGKVTRVYTWNRARTAPECATPTGAATASGGTYVVEAAIPGLGSVPASFVLRD